MISIIIPTYQEADYIARTIKNLATLPRDKYEVIVSDSRSPDTTAAVARASGADHVVVMPEGKKRGISQGRNDGAAAAKGDFFVFIDGDVIVPDPENFFNDLLARFEKEPALVAIMVPQWVERGQETIADRIFLGCLNGFYVLTNNIFHSGNASGEFQMIRADAFRKMKGFREDLVAGEDNDMFRRLSKIGRTIVYTKRSVYHSGRRIHKLGWPRMLFIWIKNGLYVAIFQKSPYKVWDTVR